MRKTPRADRPGHPTWPVRLGLALTLLCLAVPGPAGAVASGPRASADSLRAAPTRTPLRVAADTSLEKAVKSLEAPYESEHPDTDLLLSFGPSGTLRDQIMQRQLPADIFISAGEAEVGALMIGGRVNPGASIPVATNRLMLVTGLRGRLSAFIELRNPRIRRVAVGNPPTVPVGRDAVAALQRAGIWTEVKPRLRYCANSNEIVDAVARHEVDAGLVYASDALDNPAIKLVMGLDAFSDPTRYVAVALRDAAGATTGESFLRYLRSEAARERFTRCRLGNP